MNAMGNTRTVGSRWLYKLNAAAALGEGVVLLLGLLSLVKASAWLAAFPDNWLITIFKLHAGFGGAQLSLLDSVDLVDIVILALEGLAVLGLCAALWKTSRVWSIVAAVQPFLGIVLFLVTQNAGRSAAMGAALVISIVMLRSSLFNRAIAYLGIAASVLLLLGDFSAGIPPVPAIATLFAIAYVLFVAWCFLVSRRLLDLGRGSQSTSVP